MVRNTVLATAPALALVGAGGRAATGAPITYTISFTASGAVDGREFRDEPVGLVASTNTNRAIAARNGNRLVAAVATFKQLNDDPPNRQIGEPITMLLIGATLLFLPTILDAAGYTMFGADDDGLSVQSPTFGPDTLSRAKPAVGATVKLSPRFKLTLVQGRRPVKLVIRSVRGNRARSGPT